MDYWHKPWQCPFFKTDTEKSLRCEIGVFNFPDKKCAKDIMFRFCAEDYKSCPFAVALFDYYERLENHEQELRRQSYKEQYQKKRQEKGKGL